MADFEAIIHKTVENLLENTPENRVRIYERARSAIRRQLEAIHPPPSDKVVSRQLAKLDEAIDRVEIEVKSTRSTGTSNAWIDEFLSVSSNRHIAELEEQPENDKEELDDPIDELARIIGYENFKDAPAIDHSEHSLDEDVFSEPDKLGDWKNTIDSIFQEEEKSLTPLEQLLGFRQTSEQVDPDQYPELINQAIPDDLPGPSFEPGENGKLKLARSGHATKSDTERVASIRLVLIEVVEELIGLSTGSNSHSKVANLATKYRDALGENEQDLTIDLAYAYGLRLANYRAELAKGIATGDFQEGSPEVEEALQSVETLHQTMIMDTARGRELVSHVIEFENPTDVEAKRESLTEVAEAVAQNDGLIEKDDAPEIVEIAKQFATGPNPGRSSQVATLTISNMLGSIAKPIAIWTLDRAVGGIVGGVALVGTVAAYNASLPFQNHAVHFFLTHAQELTRLSLLMGGDISWVPSFIQWLKAQERK